MKNANKPATPISVSSSTHGNICSSDFEYGDGLTKREHFAGLAMQGLMSDEAGYLRWSDLAKDCVAVADALLIALEQDND
mgnify:CR=1 FL=1|tara:strand:- start:459 stop:698 length:240 start_codon:yes stop_codon:yes gene_type:complete